MKNMLIPLAVLLIGVGLLLGPDTSTLSGFTNWIVSQFTPSTTTLPPQTFQGTVLSWIQLVKSPNRQTEAQALALSFETVKQQIANKQFKTVDQMVVALRASNQTALGAAVPNWQPFFDKLQAELQVQADQGILVTLDQHAALWEILANILKTVR